MMCLSRILIFALMVHHMDACFELNVAYQGAPKGSNGIANYADVLTAEECQEACRNEEGCNFFTWNGPETHNRPNHCWLKGDDSGKNGNRFQAGKVSGPARCDCFVYDATIGRGKGNGAGKVEDVATAFDCQTECQNEEECNNWIWNSPEHARNPNVCWLKKGATEPSIGTADDINRVSGPKFCAGVPT